MIIFRSLIFHVVKSQLAKRFDEKLSFDCGPILMSMVNIHGTNKDKTEYLNCERILLSISIFGGFRTIQKRKIEIEVSNLELKIEKKPIKNHIYFNYSLEEWIKMKIAVFFTTLFIRKALVNLKNIKIISSGFAFIIESGKIDFTRTRDIISASLTITESQIIKDNPVLRIPLFSSEFYSTNTVPRLILSNKFHELSTKINDLQLSYEEGKITFQNSTIPIAALQAPEEICTVRIVETVLMIPIPDLHTKTMKISVSDISIDDGIITSGPIRISRNNQDFLNLPSLTYQYDQLKILNSLSVVVATPLIIDIALLLRYFCGSVEFNPQNRQGKSEKLKQLKVDTKTVDFRLCLSDNHVLLFTLKNVQYQNMTLSARSFSGDIEFGSTLYKFARGSKGVFNVVKPNLSLKAQTLDLIFDTSFAEGSFLQELFAIASWIEIQFRGKVAFGSNRENEPPTRRIISVEAKTFTISMENRLLTSRIHQANEAKQVAIEALAMRQFKAVQMWKAKNASYFNQQEFDKESKKMLFHYFRLALSSMPSMETSMFKAKGEDLSITVNGPAIQNYQQALNHIIDIEPAALNSPIGKISGGLLEINAKRVGLSLSHVKDVLQLHNIYGKGSFFVARPKGEKAGDYYHIHITSDCGQTVFNIPQIASRSVTFMKLNLNGESMHLVTTPVEFETLQDNRLNMALFRQLPFKYKRIAFLDFMKLRFKLALQMDFSSFHYEYNDPSRAYEHQPFVDCCFNRVRLNIDDSNMKLTSETMEILILSLHGEKKRIGLFYDPVVKLQLTRSNKQNLSGECPLFIPIDSSRLKDPSYDPFEKSRTRTYSTRGEMTFNNSKYASFSFEDRDLQSLIDEFGTPRPLSSIFRKPFRFVNPFTPLMVYACTDFSITIPPISFNFHEDSKNIKIYGSPIVITVSKKSIASSIIIAAASLDMPISLDSKEIGLIQLRGFLFSRMNSESSLTIDSVHGGISVKDIITLTKFNIHFPKKDEKNKRHTIIENRVFKDFQEFKSLYKNPIFKCLIEKCTFKIKFSEQLALLLNANKCEYNFTRDIQNGTKTALSSSLNTVIMEKLNISYQNGMKIIGINNFDANLSIASNLIVCYVSMTSFNFSFRPNDLEILQSVLTLNLSRTNDVEIANSVLESENSDSESDSNDNTTQKKRVKNVPRSVAFNEKTNQSRFNLNKILFFGGSIDVIELALIYHDSVLISSEIENLEGSFKSYPNGAENITAVVQYMKIVHDRGDDIFRVLFESTNSSETPFLNLCFVQTRRIMKCPVFEKIDIKLSPFVIRVAIPLIKKLIRIFPAFESLEMFTFDDVPTEITDEEISQNLNETFEINENNGIQINDDATVIFIKEFILDPFNAELNIRRKTKGAFKEFLQRPFNYRGLHFFDLFGSHTQITAFVRKNIKWAAIRAIPSLVFKKTKKERDSLNSEGGQDIPNQNKSKGSRRSNLPIQLEQKE